MVGDVAHELTSLATLGKAHKPKSLINVFDDFLKTQVKVAIDGKLDSKQLCS